MEKRGIGDKTLLNDAKVRAAKPREKPYKLTDSHRLYLLVTPSGGKLWRWNYSYDGKQKSMALGIHPLVSVAEARAKRNEARAILDEGRDPAIVKKLKIEANLEAARNTFERIAREWHETSKSQWAAVHAADVLRSLERDVFPSIGSLPISELTAPKILDVLEAIEERGSIETAKRVRQRISAVFVYTIAKGMAQSDPVPRIRKVCKVRRCRHCCNVRHARRGVRFCRRRPWVFANVQIDGPRFGTSCPLPPPQGQDRRNDRRHRGISTSIVCYGS